MVSRRKMNVLAIFALVAQVALAVGTDAPPSCTTEETYSTEESAIQLLQSHKQVSMFSAKAEACPPSYDAFSDQLCKISSGAQPQYWYKGGGKKPDDQVIQTLAECKAFCDNWSDCQAFSYYTDHFNGYRAQCNIVPSSASVKDSFEQAGEDDWAWYHHGTDGTVVGAYTFVGFTCYIKKVKEVKYTDFTDKICKISSGAQPQYWYKGGGKKPDDQVIQTLAECKAFCDNWSDCQAFSYYTDHFNGYRAQCNIVPSSASLKDSFEQAGGDGWAWYSHGTDGTVVGAYDFKGFTCYLKSC